MFSSVCQLHGYMYGKSLIYSVLPYAYDELRGCRGSIVIVVSPLLSLMKEQVKLV